MSYLQDTVSRSAAGSAVMSRAKAMLEGTSSDATQRSWKNAAGAILGSERGFASLDVAALQMITTVGTQIAGTPNALPVPLTAQVSELVTLLEQRLDNAAGWVRIEVSNDLSMVVDFLRQQARIRQALPLRTLQRCRTCNLEKVVNPDYKRLMERNRKIKVFSGSFGGIITGHGISPYVLIGKLLQAKQLDPDYVCPRCQGMHPDSRIVTFCPNCHVRRDEAVLRRCGDCDHDLRADLPAETLWRDEAPAEVPAQPAAWAGAAAAIGRSAVNRSAVSRSVANRSAASLSVLGRHVGSLMTPAGNSSQAGWYADPCADPSSPGQLRWWAGTMWTEHTCRPAASFGTVRQP